MLSPGLALTDQRTDEVTTLEAPTITTVSTAAPPPGGSPDEVLDAVSAMITEVVGEDYLLAIEIDMETSFNDDLEMESIEFVALAEQLANTYGERVDFVAWIADLELDEIIGMTVGQLVEYISSCLSS